MSVKEKSQLKQFSVVKAENILARRKIAVTALIYP